MTAKNPAITGFSIQVITICDKDSISVGDEVKIFHPIIAPTIACETEPGSPFLSKNVTVTEAASAVVKEPAIAFISPRYPRVKTVPDPSRTAPKIIKIPEIIAAKENLSIRLLTAVPKIFAASFAPSAHPRYKPLSKNIQTNLQIPFNYCN